MLGAQPRDEDQVPNEDPLHDPPFDFFGLGQLVNLPQFHANLNDDLDEDKPDDINEWGPWLLGESNAATAAQMPQPEPLAQDHIIDLNIPAGEEAHQPMDLDMNEVPDQDFENIVEQFPEIDNMDNRDAGQDQIGMHISDAITLQYATLDTLVQGNLEVGMDLAYADLMEENEYQEGIILGLAAQPNQENLEYEGFFLLDNLM
jgi:hypothetical protein